MHEKIEHRTVLSSNSGTKDNWHTFAVCSCMHVELPSVVISFIKQLTQRRRFIIVLPFEKLYQNEKA